MAQNSEAVAVIYALEKEYTENKKGENDVKIAFSSSVVRSGREFI